MKGLYYHPERITYGDSGLMLNTDKHSAIVHFLELLEELVPEVINDLDAVYSIYAEADNWYSTHLKGSREWPCEWHIVKQANLERYPGYVQLKDALEAWTDKYNLNGKNDFYQNLALTSLQFYYDDCKESERQKRLKEYNELAQRYNVPLETVRNSKRYSKNWPYEERLVLADNVFFEDEPDDIELSNSIGEGENLNQQFFQKVFPFSFTPDTMHFVGNIQAETYEWMRTFYELLLQVYDKKKEAALQEGKTFTLMPYSGAAWDPRNETWRGFEDRMDRAYTKYKELYRQRAEDFLLERGYVKGKEKRNLDHFKWLVHYQVEGWTLRKIADYYSNISDEIIYEDTVYRGIKSTAELVLLNLIQKKAPSL